MTISTSPESTSVPVIDISRFLSGADEATAPRLIGQAATSSGFFQIVGHGIEPRLFDDVYRKAEELDALDRPVKEGLRSPSGHPYRGLMSNYNHEGQLVSEGFTASRFDNAEAAIEHGVPKEYADYYHENVWPPIDGFQEAVIALASQTRELGAKMMQIFAVALELPKEYFDTYTEVDSTTSTIRSYPARHSAVEGDPPVIFDEHFDGGMLTMLHQRGTYEGLQVLTTAGEWFPVPVHDDAFVINIGELMHRWTNGKWPATRHRVVGAEDPAGYRYTLPTFFNMSVETLVEPLPTTVDSSGPAFDPVRVYDWESRHLRKSYEERKHTTAAASSEEYVKSL